MSGHAATARASLRATSGICASGWFGTGPPRPRRRSPGGSFRCGQPTSPKILPGRPARWRPPPTPAATGLPGPLILGSDRESGCCTKYERFRTRCPSTGAVAIHGPDLWRTSAVWSSICFTRFSMSLSCEASFWAALEPPCAEHPRFIAAGVSLFVQARSCRSTTTQMRRREAPATPAAAAIDDGIAPRRSFVRLGVVERQSSPTGDDDARPRFARTTA
jgi:hypothetical protein